ncbi:MAG: hypothetical protein RMI34_02315 [Chloroherpetonaceae bacterium]|nr:hypothetical protein [Chloroherpetonaceae bacterium]MCS7210280.1 hypothetical protein [Chloroherpetonaceae bacterium]MDW8018890.1 hypothetical protein [Chloroherpetonaceae bacterium]
MTLAILAYWAIGIACAIFFLADELFPNQSNLLTRQQAFRRNILFFVSLVVVLGNIYVYYNATSNGGRPFDISTFFIFAILNGACETFIFLSVFKFGEKLVQRFTNKAPYLFMGGVLMFMVFSGFIHGVLWINALPPHVVSIADLPPDKVIFKQLFFPFQVALVICWSMLYFFFRDVWGIVVLHSIVDAGVVYSIHYSLWENTSTLSFLK